MIVTAQNNHEPLNLVIIVRVSCKYCRTRDHGCRKFTFFSAGESAMTRCALSYKVMMHLIMPIYKEWGLNELVRVRETDREREIEIGTHRLGQGTHEVVGCEGILVQEIFDDHFSHVHDDLRQGGREGGRKQGSSRGVNNSISTSSSGV